MNWLCKGNLWSGNRTCMLLHDYMRAMSINKLGLERQNGLAHIERREQFQSSTMAGIYCLGLGFEVKVGSCPCNFPEACWSCEIYWFQSWCIGQLHVDLYCYSILRSKEWKTQQKSTKKVQWHSNRTCKKKEKVTTAYHDLVTRGCLHKQAVVVSQFCCCQTVFSIPHPHWQSFVE